MSPRTSRRRPRLGLLAGLALLCVLAGGAYGGLTATGKPQWTQRAGSSQPQASESAKPQPSTAVKAATAEAITLAATGDNVMGGPGNWPANNGRDIYKKVTPLLKGDLVMGNLEEPVTVDTGFRKCSAGSTQCHQFYAPPSWAGYLKSAGYQLMNMANNHGNDMGSAGYRNTQKSLEAVGLKHTGAPGEITLVEVKGVKVAVVGFSSYAWNNSLINISKAQDLIKHADAVADIVVVQVHMGREGTAYTHVSPGTEMFLGENRGDPIAFSHAMIDAGADLVVGHGPHVLRAMEFYKGRLIAYSLGNFLGGGRTLKPDGILGYGGVLKVQLAKDGTWVGGKFESTRMDSGGIPAPDSARNGAKTISNLSASDFPNTGMKIDSSGKIIPPTP
jgi:poly-gamma-glutamate capsule biosynthesis protein CapA/YwtB (metallophosphatase superfamily)